MRKFFRRSYPKKKRAVLRKKKRTAMKRSKKTLTQKVNALVRASETKQSVYGSTVVMSGADTANFAAQIIPLYPTNGYLLINRGTASNQRVGNRVKVKNAYLRTMFYINNPLAPSTFEGIQPYMIKFMIFKFKSGIDPALITTVATRMKDSFFESDAGLDAGISGGPTDMLYPVNEENFSVLYSRTLKIGYSTNVWGPNTGAGQQANQAYYNFANNDYPMNVVHRVNVTNMIQKNLIFQDNITGTNQTVTNVPPVFMAAWLVPANGTRFDTQTWTPVTMVYRYEIKYSDA